MTVSCILVLNCGSSSIKFSVYGETSGQPGKLVCHGSLSHVPVACHFRVVDGKQHILADTSSIHIADLQSGLDFVLDWLEKQEIFTHLSGAGHRVVHGGVEFSGPVHVTSGVMERLETLVDLAPLHQPFNLLGIRKIRERFPDIPQIACFDTAFHRGHPWVADTFALPEEFYLSGIRRYGFHGLSFEYIMGYLKRNHPDKAGGRIIVAHLGNGASMCAIQNGQSMDSTMGFTALEGLPMGTRCGQIDPGLLLHWMSQGWTQEKITSLLYKKSGLLGLSGISSDMQTLEESDTPESRKAIEYQVYRVTREVGGLTSVLHGLDTLIFTAGIGENSPLIRKKVCESLEWMGVVLNQAKNEAHEEIISDPQSRIQVMIIPTNEEEMIANHVFNLLSCEDARTGT